MCNSSLTPRPLRRTFRAIGLLPPEQQAQQQPEINVNSQVTPTETIDAGAQRAKLIQRRRASALGGRQSTILSPPGGSATGQQKKLLGS